MSGAYVIIKLYNVKIKHNINNNKKNIINKSILVIFFHILYIQYI